MKDSTFANRLFRMLIIAFSLSFSYWAFHSFKTPFSFIASLFVGIIFFELGVYNLAITVKEVWKWLD
jgi:hypothetical protein